MTITVVENSWLAKIAAWKLGGKQVAMVFGTKIYLHGCNKEEFLRNKNWVRHEIAHVHQWKKFGKFWFLYLYLLESLRKGYYNNKFEVEARNKETDPFILNGVEIT